ncbi:Lectin C-type domain protein [Planctomycetes bacterium K2D]|uniref:Lectin C-type domain protein n=2 Tax=Botrimarina mediterranea TaxID=2528022 RepID=A0A518KA33_9BACT|nr:Lectin C-type domain protein [Botrimarina mediterranea]QDV79286.1 Lectin C-type domain protein [Planctomycetes bacterium K2D]
MMELRTAQWHSKAASPMRIVAAVILMLALQPIDSSAQSFIELGRTTYGGNDYLLVGLQPTTGSEVGTMNPFEAQDAADFFGGWLMTVSSREEEVTVVEGLRDFQPTAPDSYSNLWIGFTDRDDFGTTEGNFVWQNGEPVVYTNWAPGEPNDAGATGEDWGEIWTINPADVAEPDYISWNDERDTKTNFAIVEMIGVPPPLVIEVNPITGIAYFASTFAGEDILSVTLTDYQVRPDGVPFNVADWQATNLSARGVDAMDPAASGQRWEVIDNSLGQLIESYLLGGSEMVPGERMMLGKLFPNGVSEEVSADLTYAVNIDYADPERADSQAVIYGDLVQVPIVLVDPDYNDDGAVNAADYSVWRDSKGSTGAGLAADGNGDGVVDDSDYGIWAASYGASASASDAKSVPTPTAISLVSIVSVLSAGWSGRRH